MAGSIPLIAIQLVALQVGEKIALHCVRVLDQTALRTDDEYETGGGRGGQVEINRAYWEHKASDETLGLTDTVLNIVNEESGQPHALRYRKAFIVIVPERNGHANIWVRPRKPLRHDQRLYGRG